MELHNFDHSNIDHGNLDHDLHTNLDSIQSLEEQHDLIANGMDIQQDYTNSYQMDVNQVSNLLDNQQLTYNQFDYSAISTEQHFDLSPSSQMQEGFNNQYLDADNVHQNNMLEHQNMGDSHSQPHNIDHNHNLQRTGTSRSELLKDAKYYERQANSYNNEYKTYSNNANSFRKDGNGDEAYHWQDKANTAAKHADEYAQKAQDARDKANNMS